jgi:hypothetical protein
MGFIYFYKQALEAGKDAYRGKANTATTAFARSRLPRSLLIAHSADADAGFVGVC